MNDHDRGDEEDDTWEQVAKAAEAAKTGAHQQLELPNVPNAPRCPLPTCRVSVAVSEHGMVKVHFTKVTDARPCPASFQPLVPKPAKPPAP